MTPRQQQILAYVVGYRAQHGVAPTLGEIAKAHGVSKTTISLHVQALERLGMISVDKHKTRSIVVIEGKPGEAVKIIRDVADRVIDAKDAAALRRAAEMILAA